MYASKLMPIETNEATILTAWLNFHILPFLSLVLEVNKIRQKPLTGFQKHVWNPCCYLVLKGHSLQTNKIINIQTNELINQQQAWDILDILIKKIAIFQYITLNQDYMKKVYDLDNRISKLIKRIEQQLLGLIIKMSSNFLQRFKGKTTTLSKDAVHNILGTKNVVSVQPNNQSAQEPNNSMNKQKLSVPDAVHTNISDDIKNKTSKQAAQNVAVKANKTENPFLVSNPFYLDEEERERQEIQRKQRLRIQQQTRKAQLAQNNIKDKKDPKQITKTSGYSKSVQKKNTTNKQWVKLGGLGANIGGDEWLERKKKQQKMQQFAGQVKSINAEKIKPPKPDIPKQKDLSKQANARQKALEYSKNVPKPAIRKFEQQEQEDVQIARNQAEKQELTELQIYQMKHEQLKRMINNNY